VPYIPNGSYNELGSIKVITVTDPLSKSSQYFVKLVGLADITHNLLIETLEGSTVTDSQLITNAIGNSEIQGAAITLSDSGGILEFTALSPTISPSVSIPDSLLISGLVGTSAEMTFNVSETGGQQPITKVLISISDLTDQMGGTISSNKLLITPTDFTVTTNGNQKVTIQIDMAGLKPGVYFGGILLATENSGTLMIPFTLKVQFHNVYLPVSLKD
jgi:hypothetical protein